MVAPNLVYIVIGMGASFCVDAGCIHGGGGPTVHVDAVCIFSIGGGTTV